MTIININTSLGYDYHFGLPVEIDIDEHEVTIKGRCKDCFYEHWSTIYHTPDEVESIRGIDTDKDIRRG
jgi:hypothetical protein